MFRIRRGEEEMTKNPTIEIIDGTNGRAMYIEIDGYTFYIDNTTDEQIMECWKDKRLFGKRVLVK